MPNIGAFLAWGLLTALFLPTGWAPNESLAKLINPMIMYMLPLLIAYTAGYNISGIRGGVMAVIASMGVIVGGDIPMFIGVMIMGPIAGWLIKKNDLFWSKRTPSGFEMLINNFSLGILGALVAIVGFFAIGPLITILTSALQAGVDWTISHGLLPLASILVEPAKVLFLNNAINHGIFSPIGILQSESSGQSIMFLIESNPGSGLGLLLAYSFFGKGTSKSTAPGAAIIHFLGGIHEIYFPYVLSNPKLIIAPILGSASAIAFFNMMDIGLVAPASPGSIFAILMMTMKSKWAMLLLGVLIATTVSFIVASLLIKQTPARVEEQTEDFEIGDTKKIVFACDAGMGSSAMGASRFKNRLKEHNISLDVTHSAVDQIPADTDIIVSQGIFKERCFKSAPNAIHIEIKNFLSDKNLDLLFETILKQEGEKERIEEYVIEPENVSPNATETEAKINPMFTTRNILLNLPSEDKNSAIRRAGQLLAHLGYTDASYTDAMLERESMTSTYMGMGIAIPHGTKDAKESIKASGFVFLQYPQGVNFGEEDAQIVIGIAGVGDEHLEILSQLASVLEDDQLLDILKNTSDKNIIINSLI